MSVPTTIAELSLIADNNYPKGTSSIGGAESPDKHIRAAYALIKSAYNVIPSGTTMLFMQAAAPVGWTKLTTHNNKALRIVSGTGGVSGGSVAFSTAFASKSVAGSIDSTTATGTIGSTTATGSITGSVSATTLSAAQIPSHNHKTSEYSPSAPFGYWTSTTERYSPGAASGFRPNTDVTGGGQSHTHSDTFEFSGTAHSHPFTGTAHGHTFTGTAIDLAVQYVDAIICTKN